MRIKNLLLLLIFMGSTIVSYTQEPQGIVDNGQAYKVPPRREIRHLLSDNRHEALPFDSNVTRASGEYIMKEFPTQGEIKGIVLLVNYQDVKFHLPDDSIRSLLQQRFDGENYTEEINFEEYSEVYGQVLPLKATIPGSARDYFRDQSMGKFTPRFDVIGPITLDNPRKHYGANTSNGGDKNARAMISDACSKAYEQGLTDFTDYDYDKDGIVDFVYIVYAGSDEAQTKIEECVWAHAHTISLTLANGMKVERYACSGELVIDLPVCAGIGTFVHEFGHILGLPDFYNTLQEDFTMDIWSVMDYGMYNAEGFVPCGYTSFERYSLGWLPMHTLDAPATMSLGTTEEEGRGYRIFTSEIDTEGLVTAADTASFYLVETIRREGWNRYAATAGMLITQVTYKASAWQNNKVNTEDSHRYYVVPANNDYNYKTANKHLFGRENHEFSLISTPASITQHGAAMDKPITDINYDAGRGVTTFHFRGGGVEMGMGEIIKHDSGIVFFYDLQGRSAKHPSKGICIQNGKKYLAF